MQALDIDSTLPLPLFGMAQLMSNQAGGVDKALANLEKALDKVPTTFPSCVPGAQHNLICSDSALSGVNSRPLRRKSNLVQCSNQSAVLGGESCARAQRCSAASHPQVTGESQLSKLEVQ